MAVTIRTRVERSLVWRVWERMLEIEFVDRSIALAGKAFVSFFPMVIVIASLMPDRIRTSILSTITTRLGMQGDALRIARDAFASSDDVKRATTVTGLIFTVFFATSFTTALQRVYVRSWRRPAPSGIGHYGRGIACLSAVLASLAVLGVIRNALHGGLATGMFAVLALATTSGLWWFISWYLLLGDVRSRVLVPTGVITGALLAAYAVAATLWMPGVVRSNEEQFGFFGVALSLVTWLSGAATCVIVGACAGPTLAESQGRLGSYIRGGIPQTLIPSASPSLPPPTRDLSLRDAFQSTDDT